MIGSLYHSGGEPLHALTLRLGGVGLTEVQALVNMLPALPEDTSLAILSDPPAGLRVTLRTDATEQQAQELVARVFAARRARQEDSR